MPKINENRMTHDVRFSLNEFLIDRRSSRLSPRTLEFYLDELVPFLEYLEAESVEDVTQITPNHIRSHLLDLEATRNAGGVHCRFRAVRAWLNWAWDDYEFKTRNPVQRVKPPKVSSTPLPGVPLETVFKLVAHVDEGMYPARDRAVLLCLLDTGARCAEFIALNWNDVNLISGDVLIRSGKGGKARTVYLGKRAQKAIRAWHRVAPRVEHIWTTRFGGRLTFNGLREIVRRRSKSAGLEAPGLHDFRRACLLAMLRNGADAVTVSRYAGHADVRVTLRYLAQTDDDLREAHAKASPVDNWL